MKIFYFLLLTISISCLNPALLNSLEFQKQKTNLLKNAMTICSNRSKLSFNDTFIKNYTFSSDFALEFFSVNNFEQEVNKLNLPNDAKKSIIFSRNQKKPSIGSECECSITLKSTKVMNLNISLVTSTQFNSTEGTFIGCLYLKGKTKAYLKDLHDVFRQKVCRKVGIIFKKCHYETHIEERFLTDKEFEVSRENVYGNTLSELNKLLLNKL